jgi:indole-3-glycerol phosphate synthase
VIAEIKRKSPSKGSLASIKDPVELAKRYVLGGASALSILTDEAFFGGSINDLTQVADALRNQSIPIIRKDFIIDQLQIAEAAVAGASAVLCIVSVLGTQTKALLEFAHSLNLDVLVEIHDQEELKIALESGADIIGINNRNLHTFDVDTNRALQIVASIPDNIIKVAESGITDSLAARQYYQAGFGAVLIGEALVKSNDPAHFITKCIDD